MKLSPSILPILTMVGTLFEDLPLEVLALIFDQVDSLKELCSFMLVSHRFYDIAGAGVL